MEARKKSLLFVEIVTLLHIALFIYASISKILDYENFQIQLGQSPLLSAFTGLISWGIPSAEILIAISLAFPKSRVAGLIASLLLMIMFSAYIFIVLHFSNYIPCGCGGILENMRWEEHLVFNIAFVLLSASAIFVHYTSKGERPEFYNSLRKPAAILIASLLLGIGSVTGAHLASSEIIHHHNSFIRRFPNNPDKVREFDLKYDSYYFSGFEDGKIYLGNYTAPSLLTTLDSLLRKQSSFEIRYPDSIPAYRSLNLQVLNDNFYIIDGTVPMILKGRVGEWTATMAWRGEKQFSQAKFMDSSSVALRAFGTEDKTALGILSMDSPKVELRPGLIKKQIDGVFDADGTLQFDKITGAVVYAYYYRNQFIVTDTNLHLVRVNTTIDTISKADIKIAYVKSRNETKLAAPPTIVNRAAYADNGLLYVNSSQKSRYEGDLVWKQATVIDVYDIRSGKYISSFYVYNINGKKLRSFMVSGKHLYALIGSTLVDYYLYDGLLKEAIE